MKKAAAITGSLVDVRNVGTHKCVKLTIHVPAEFATKVFECFGWPTGVDPVMVALARLDLSMVTKEPSAPAPREADSDLGQTPGVAASRHRKPVAADKRLAQQAGIACADVLFQKFIGARDEDMAAELVRRNCGVTSRSGIVLGTDAGSTWDFLYSRFIAWRDVPDMAPPIAPEHERLNDCQGERI